MRLALFTFNIVLYTALAVRALYGQWYYPEGVAVALAVAAYGGLVAFYESRGLLAIPRVRRPGR